MKLLLAAMLIAAPLAAQSPPVEAGEGPQAVLVRIWQENHDTTSLACLYGKRTPDGFSIDSITIARACGAPAIGVLGFVDGSRYEEENVLAQMGRVLDARPDLAIAGEVYGVTRELHNGKWGLYPRVWAAFRPAV